MVIAGFFLNRPVRQTTTVVQGLLLRRSNLPDAEHGPCTHSTITSLATLQPVPNEPSVARSGRNTEKHFLSVARDFQLSEGTFIKELHSFPRKADISVLVDVTNDKWENC